MNILELDRVVSGSWNRPVSLSVRSAEVIVLVGRNGVGKTTLLNTIAGLVPIRSGRLLFMDKDATQLPGYERAQQGIRIALEGRRVFPRLSVRKNLLLGAASADEKKRTEADLEMVISIFPNLREKLNVPAGVLSGGQQTQLNIARALMGRPKLLLLDEPTLGLDPRNVNTVINVINNLSTTSGLPLLVAEQCGRLVEAFPKRVLVMSGGEFIFDGEWEDAVKNEELLMALP